jgi:hypothetical protein
MYLKFLKNKKKAQTIDPICFYCLGYFEVDPASAPGSHA